MPQVASPTPMYAGHPLFPRPSPGAPSSCEEGHALLELGPADARAPGVEEAEKITARVFKKGLYLMNMGAFGTRALRVAPPLIINGEQADACLEILESAISEVEKEF